MSKRGKSVLDGLQKLKENNPRLQANVMGILARASADQKLQLESYMKAIDKNRFKVFLPPEEAELANSAGAAS